MNRTLAPTLIPALLCALPMVGQDRTTKSESVPLYRVTVVERSVEAVNYQYRSGPTEIDFRGTVLLADAKGRATVESRRGRTEIDAKFERIVAPSRFGREYLTYVLWAISPDGAPHNLGEVVADSSDHSHLTVTTDLQVFGLIVTAEPYSSVRQPSDVVALENRVRPDTIGRTQPIQAKFELLPRGQYTYQVQDSLAAAVNNAPKVSMSQYEALLELYQAQNALGVARAANAEKYAPNTLAKAQQAYDEAQRLQASKSDYKFVVQNARAAAETAEDARVISERRARDEQLVNAQAELAQAQQAKAQAEAAAEQARAEAQAAKEQAAAERAARERVEAQASAARQQAPQVQAERVQPAVIARVSPPAASQAQTQQAARIQLLERLNGVLTTRDTPRGLVVTITDDQFSGGALQPGTRSLLARLAPVLASQPGLHIAVEAYSDGAEVQTEDRAAAVRAALLAQGLPGNSVSSQGLGDTRPLASNATERGRIENRRVEIVISGDAIGTLPFWDRTYSVEPVR